MWIVSETQVLLNTDWNHQCARQQEDTDGSVGQQRVLDLNPGYLNLNTAPLGKSLNSEQLWPPPSGVSKPGWAGTCRSHSSWWESAAQCYSIWWILRRDCTLTSAWVWFPGLVKCSCVCLFLFNLHFDEIFLHAFLSERYLQIVKKRKEKVKESLSGPLDELKGSVW